MHNLKDLLYACDVFVFGGVLQNMHGMYLLLTGIQANHCAYDVFVIGGY